MVAAGRIPAYFDNGSKAMMALIRSPGEGEGFVAGTSPRLSLELYKCGLAHKPSLVLPLGEMESPLRIFLIWKMNNARDHRRTKGVSQ